MGISKINENKILKERREMFYRQSKQDKNQLLWYYNPNWVSKTHSNIANMDAHTQKPKPQPLNPKKREKDKQFLIYSKFKFKANETFNAIAIRSCFPLVSFSFFFVLCILSFSSCKTSDLNTKWDCLYISHLW